MFDSMGTHLPRNLSFHMGYGSVIASARIVDLLRLREEIIYIIRRTTHAATDLAALSSNGAIFADINNLPRYVFRR
jgi:hypothetical protein